MSRGASTGLWICAGVMLAATAGFYFVDPFSDSASPREERTELDSAVARAATYYEFGHYNRAAETYRLAVERGLQDGVEWYRYAHARELAEDLDLATYATAFRLLLDQAPFHEYVELIQEKLDEHAIVFRYVDAREARYAPGTLVTLNGTVSRTIWGRVASGMDTLVLATRVDDWLGHMGEEVLVEAERRRRYPPGEQLSIVGRYEGLCRPDGDPTARTYPCITALGVRPLQR